MVFSRQIDREIFFITDHQDFPSCTNQGNVAFFIRDREDIFDDRFAACGNRSGRGGTVALGQVSGHSKADASGGSEADEDCGLIHGVWPYSA